MIQHFRLSMNWTWGGTRSYRLIDSQIVQPKKKILDNGDGL